MPKKQSIENQITRKQESLEKKRQQLLKQQEAIKKLEEDLKELQVSRYKKWVESFQDELIRLGDTIDIESISVKDVIEYMTEMAPATEKKADAAPAKDAPNKEQKEKEADKKAIAKAIEDAFVPDDEPSHDNEDKKTGSEHKAEDTKEEEDRSSDKKDENKEKDSSNNEEDNFFQRPQVFG